MMALVVQWLSSWEMDTVSRVQILNEAFYISRSAKTQIYSPFRNRKIIMQIGHFNVSMATDLGDRKH